MPGPGDQLGFALVVEQRGLGLGHRLDAEHVAARAAVLKIPIDGLGQIGARDETAETLDELAPVRHQRRSVEQVPGDKAAIDPLFDLRLFGETDKDGCGGTDPLDGLGAGIHFFHVHSW